MSGITTVKLDAPPTGCLAAFTTKGGERFVTMIERDPDGTFSVRIEDGWYYQYREDGVRLNSGVILYSDGRSAQPPATDYRDIVAYRIVDADECSRLIDDEGYGWGLHP